MNKIPEERESFLKDIAVVMENHKIDHLICVYYFPDEQINNIYIYTKNINPDNYLKTLSEDIHSYMTKGLNNEPKNNP